MDTFEPFGHLPFANRLSPDAVEDARKLEQLMRGLKVGKHKNAGAVVPPVTSSSSLLPSNADYEIKSWVPFFSAMITGEKKHDMRKLSDRPYRVGDKVLLREYEPFGGGYTGRSAIFRITYITSNVTPCALSSNALANDHCILSVERISDVFEDA